MAQITLDQLRKIVEANVDWGSRGESPPGQLLDLSLWVAGQTGGGTTFDPTLARKTLTFEGRSVTVVLDFDDQGYLQNIEFV